MKELEYPFDSAYIMKKRKSLKRALLSDGTTRLKKKIAVLGGSTTNDIIAITELFLLDAGIEPEFYQSEYAQYWQDAMFPSEELAGFAPDIVFIHTTNRNITEYPQMTDSPETVKAMLDKEFDRFKQMWQALQSRFNCPIIQNNFELPLFRLLGNKDCSDYRGRSNFINRLNSMFYEYSQNNGSFYINDINYISAGYGLKEWSNPLYCDIIYIVKEMRSCS